MKTSILFMAAVASMLLPAIGTTTAGASPLTSTPSVLSSAPPLSFTSENFTYLAQASVPVNWSAGTTGLPYSVLTSSPLSQYATLRGSPPAGSHSFSLKAVAPSGGGTTWQNWTMTTYALPFIYSIPYFTPNAGDFYNYTPTFVGSGTFSFTGAPYLTVNPTHGWVSGTVTAGTYTNTLRLNTTSGNYTQAWVTTTSNTPPSTVTFNCYLGNHYSTVTVTLVSGYAAGCGNEGVFSGEYPIFQAANRTSNVPFLLTDSPTTGYSIYTTTGAAASVIAWFYAPPFTASTLVINSQAQSTPTFPSSGFTNLTFSAPLVPATGAVITVSPNSGVAGSLYVVTGSAFTGTSGAFVSFNGVKQTASSCSSGQAAGTTITTTAGGGFVCTFVVPTLAVGAYSVTGTDVATGTVSTVSYTVTSVAPSPSPSPTAANLFGNGAFDVGIVLIVVGLLVAVLGKGAWPVGVVILIAGVGLMAATYYSL